MRKQGIWVTRFVLLLLFLFVVAFMGYHIVDAFTNPVGTVEAALYTIESTIEAGGVFVRDEYLIPEPSGIVEAQAAEGARVALGDTVALIYETEAARQVHGELTALAERIEQLEYTRRRAVDITDPSALDRSIVGSVLDIIEAVDSRALGDLRQKDMELRSLAYKRAYTYEGGSDLDSLIGRLTAEYEEKRKTVDMGSTPVRADKSGTFSRTLDGYEGILTFSGLDEMTPSALRSLLDKPPAPDAPACIGKLALGFTWRYAAVMPSDRAAALQPGARVNMRAGRGGKTVSVTVQSVSEEEKGNRLVILEGDRDMGYFITLRRQSVEILQDSVSGVRMPRSAVRVNEEGVTGVYCLVANRARFKPVEILLERDNYYLVAYTPEERNSLLPGDEIIVRAKNLYDGKVIA